MTFRIPGNCGMHTPPKVIGDIPDVCDQKSFLGRMAENGWRTKTTWSLSWDTLGIFKREGEQGTGAGGYGQILSLSEQKVVPKMQTALVSICGSFYGPDMNYDLKEQSSEVVVFPTSQLVKVFYDLRACMLLISYKIELVYK
ncbi:hypothetical protein BDQ17DRAFT_1330524 [Cyathus striatus]|nr:hypothetical protein BDQ17DRAFT_1330524 [Cyathus striatus]